MLDGKKVIFDTEGRIIEFTPDLENLVTYITINYETIMEAFFKGDFPISYRIKGLANIEESTQKAIAAFLWNQEKALTFIEESPLAIDFSELHHVLIGDAMFLVNAFHDDKHNPSYTSIRSSSDIVEDGDIPLDTLSSCKECKFIMHQDPYLNFSESVSDYRSVSTYSKDDSAIVADGFEEIIVENDDGKHGEDNPKENNPKDGDSKEDDLSARDSVRELVERGSAIKIFVSHDGNKAVVVNTQEFMALLSGDFANEG